MQLLTNYVLFSENPKRTFPAVRSTKRINRTEYISEKTLKIVVIRVVYRSGYNVQKMAIFQIIIICNAVNAKSEYSFIVFAESTFKYYNTIII